jgi:hypothetical protein
MRPYKQEKQDYAGSPQIVPASNNYVESRAAFLPPQGSTPPVWRVPSILGIGRTGIPF